MNTLLGSQFLDFFALNGPKKRSSGNDDIFIELIRQYGDLWKDCFIGDCIVCCPVSASIGTESLPKEQLMSHILVPGRISGEFISLLGQQVHISSNYLICGAGFKEARKVKILNVGQLTDYGKTITTYQLSRPLVGGISNTPEEVDEMSSAMMFKYVATLRTFPELEAAFSSLDEYIREVRVLGKMSSLEGYSKIKPSLSSALKIQWQKTCDRIVRTGALTTTLGGGDSETVRLQIAQIIESYMMHNLVEFIYPWLCERMNSSRVDNSYKLSHIHTLIESLSYCTQSDLGIAPEFQTSQADAVRELCLLVDAHAPVDKMLVMKRTVSLIRDAVDRNVSRKFRDRSSELDFATDDLVLILLWVIIQSHSKHRFIAVDILFCSEFHFTSASRSQLGYNLCHFEVAMSWITDRTRCCRSTTRLNECLVSPMKESSNSHASSSGAPEETVTETSFEAVSEEAATIRRLSVDLTHVDTVPTKTSAAADGNEHSAGTTPNTTTLPVASAISLPSLIVIENLRANILWTREALISGHGRKASFDNSYIHPETRELDATTSNDGADCGTSLTTIYSGRVSSRNAGLFGTRQIISEESNTAEQLSCLSSGEDYCAAVTNKGQVYTWGRPDCGRLGRGAACELDAFRSSGVPRLVSGLDSSCRIKQVSCGRNHMLAVSESGEVYVWGDNRCGQLGLFDLSMKVSDKATNKASKYSALAELMLASELSVVGATTPTVLQIIRHIKMVAVACGAYHSLCLASDGQVYSWGRAANGRLGQFVDKSNSAENQVGRPAVVRCRWQPVPPFFTEDLESMASPVSDNESYFSGNLYNTPNSSQRSTSLASVDSSTTPSKVRFITAGFNYSVAITECGAVYTWGCGTYGALGHGSHCDEYLPRQVLSLSIPGIRFVSASATHHTLFRTDSGMVFGCGLNDVGQVGAMSVISPPLSKLDRISVLVPRPVICSTDNTLSAEHYVVQVSCGEYHSAAIVANTGSMSSRRLLVWGDWERDEQSDKNCGKMDITDKLPAGHQSVQIAGGASVLTAVTTLKT